ncbi:hypothetical protein BKE30_11040 [Alkanindiges hydrocarboniclasticus]|uniref:DUF1963 domain-containing protein n=2 Tax=Alkanindiges hydrocarboniclasticus TaxID=1907941 RepID=A0A1S8CS27_9GAMM|nr:hypothetical protein BKE30_11040 [Alkanindiges hydrocarboniclasticus]
MQHIDLSNLPEILKPLEQGIQSSLKSYLAIEAKPAAQLDLWQSKFGGLPYSPLDQPYPVDDEGSPLVLLAQFNFAELPTLENFPDQGILQFYIAADDDLYGADFDQPFKQDSFRVVYFEEVIRDESQLLTDFGFLPQIPDRLTPITGQYALHAVLKQAPVSLSDFSFSRWMLREPYSGDENDQFYEIYNEQFGSTGHKLGGYPFFTQADPREYDQDIQDYILLFQMDSDYSSDVDIMWGDVGVANFFIRPEDLKNRDFSKVLYNWDCS